MTYRRAPLRPERIRTPEPPFAWLPCRLLIDGTLGRMTHAERELYLLLVLAADRHGISFYGDRSIMRTLDLTQGELVDARTRLIRSDLVAYDGATYQVLQLALGEASPQPSRRRTEGQAVRAPTKDPTPHHRLEPETDQPDPPSTPNGMPDNIREILRKVFRDPSF